MMLKVARTPHLNAEAFYVDMERRGLSLYDILPGGVAAAIETGEIDAGPVPLVDAFRLADQTKPVSGFCIATTEKAMSVSALSGTPMLTPPNSSMGFWE